MITAQTQKIKALQNVKHNGTLAVTNDLADEVNPELLFSCVATTLLSQIVLGKIDPRELAWKQLRNRGLNAKGEWVGFPKQNKPEPKKPFK